MAEESQGLPWELLNIDNMTFVGLYDFYHDSIMGWGGSTEISFYSDLFTFR